jgi:hypothetical protein
MPLVIAQMAYDIRGTNFDPESTNEEDAFLFHCWDM